MLSLKTQYGLTAIVSLAAHYGKGPLQAREIAESQAVPVRYLELLLAQLRKTRLVEATRGKRGGYILAKPPDSMTVFDIVTAFEGKVLVSPLKESGEREGKPSALSFVWKEAEKLVIDYFKSIKISDILESARANKEMYFI
jgi:Rrf2 family cysteine metabolism transcriptional repressor